MHDSKEGQDPAESKDQRRSLPSSVNQHGEPTRPEQARNDEAIGQHSHGHKFTLKMVTQFGFRNSCSKHARVTQDFTGIHGRKSRKCGNAGDCHRRVVPFGRGVKTLRRNFNPDENKNGKDGRLGNDQIQVTEITKDSRSPNEQCRCECISGTPSHRLVGRVADIRSGLNDATTQARDQRGECFDANHLTGIKFVARRCRTFGAINTANYRC